MLFPTWALMIVWWASKTHQTYASNQTFSSLSKTYCAQSTKRTHVDPRPETIRLDHDFSSHMSALSQKDSRWYFRPMFVMYVVAVVANAQCVNCARSCFTASWFSGIVGSRLRIIDVSMLCIINLSHIILTPRAPSIATRTSPGLIVWTTTPRVCA